MLHYFRYLLKVFKKRINLADKLRYTVSYLKIILQANLYDKIFISSQRKNTTRKIRLLGFLIKFYSFPFLLNLFEEIFIDEIYSVDNLGETITIMDCGSNIGLSIFYFKMKFPRSKIIGFEPDPDIFRILLENIKNNKLDDVMLYEIGLGKRNTGAVFYKDNNYIDSLNGSYLKSPIHTHSHSVATYPLSSFIFEKIEVVKIDIEGLEDEVIEDLIENNKVRFFNNILLEYHIQCLSPLETIVKKMKEAGFQSRLRYSISSSFPEKMVCFKLISND